jgi:hypothetical protein
MNPKTSRVRKWGRPFARKWRLWASAGLLLLLSCGCRVIPGYPPQLPPLATVETLRGAAPDITGRFSNKGEAFSPDGRAMGEVSLSDLIYGTEGAGPGAIRRPDAVAILGPTNAVLTLKFLERNQVVSAVWRRDGHPYATPDTYVGNKGFNWLIVRTEHGGAAGIGGYASEESIWLRKARDGSLIVLHRKVATGMALIVPFAGAANRWCWFPATPE